MEAGTNPEVLIAGAGPVGLMAACELVRYGLTVRIVDKTAEPTDKSKALVVWPRTLEHLDRMGIAGRFLAAGLKATEAHFFQVGKLIASIPLDTVETPFPFGLMIPQSETECLLIERLGELGVAVERPVTVTALADGTVTLAKADGSTERVTPRWIIGADGAHSTLRHAIGASFEGTTLASDWVLADFHQAGPVPVDTVELHFHKDGILALFPIPPDRVRVIANINSHGAADDPAPHDPTMAEIQQLMDTRDGRGMQTGTPVWLSAFHINERKVVDFRAGNVFLMGDAAHIHSPAGGQGMNTGMQDAVNLAWKLALVHHGLVSPSGGETLLNSYTAERSPVARQVLRGAGLLTEIGTLGNPVLRGLRNTLMHFVTGFETVQHAFAETVTELAIAYPETPLNSAQKPMKGGPKPGERAPVSTSPVSAGDRPQYVLYAKPGPNAKTLIDCYSALFEPTERPPFAEGGVWIVRPDGYVGFAGDSDSWAAADRYLGSLVWPQAG
jgi:2-polyprenyl-6-methoxyphenol hydroxylase-like FAD-dependent oxidoreductase